MTASYLDIAQINCDPTAVAEHKQKLLSHLQANSKKTDVIWQYFVPELGEGGSCSLFGQLQDKPFVLSNLIDATNPENSLALAKLQSIVNYIVATTKVDWFGINQKRLINQEPELVKLAYFGEPSRATFPLTSQFSAISNNVQVGLSRIGRIINDIPQYLVQGGEYYTCDPKVQSEACLPILTETGELLGIIDAEAFSLDFFDQNTLALLVAACLVITECLPAS